MARRARTLWRELEAESGEDLLHECGIAWFAHSDDGWEAQVSATMEAQDIPVERLDVAAAAAVPEPGRRRPRVRPARARGGGPTRAAGRAHAGAAGAANGARLVHARAHPEGDTVVLAHGARLEADVVVWACGGWLTQLFGDLVSLTVTRQELLFLDGGPEWQAPGCPAGSITTARCTAPPTSTSLGVKAALDVEGPPLDPDAALLDTPTTGGVVRDYMRRALPGAGAGAAERGARVPLRAVARLALHRRPHPEQRGCGSSAAAPATASSTARRWPSGSRRRSRRDSAAGAVRARWSHSRPELRTAGSGVVT